MIASQGRYKLPPHLARLNFELKEIAEGRNDRLIVSLPPRHGKSETISRYFPAWFLGMNPDKRIVVASHGTTLAETFSEQSRAVLREYGPRFFDVEVSRESASKATWKIEGREGAMIAVGVGSSITGRGGDCLVIDDPVKDAADANSQVMRAALEQWYTSTAYSRLEPNAAVIIVSTRWHESDLVGMRLRLEPGRWRVLNLPAIAEADDPIGRPIGEALWPARYPIPVLAEIKQVQGSYWWNALYMGSPTSAGGSVFKKEWFRYAVDMGDHYGLVQETGLVRRVPKAMCRKMQFVDLAASLKTKADYFVIGTFAVTPWNDLIAVDMLRTRVEGPDQLGCITQQYHLHRPAAVGIEKTGYQMTMIQTAIRAGLPAIELVPDADKYTRALSSAARYEAGTVYHLRDAPWVADLEAELLAFPNGAHDDQVDVGSYAARWLAANNQGVATATKAVAGGAIRYGI